MELVVTGTGTDVGKTVACSVLLARYVGRIQSTYWKPVATGSRQGSDSALVASLVGPKLQILEECYQFPSPVSPHLAAQLAGFEIDPWRILQAHKSHQKMIGKGLLVMEGIGGLLVPLTENGYLLADLLNELNLPCLVVASSTLGTINHTLLTIEALRSRGLCLLGVVLNGPPNEDNRKVIERLGRTQVVAEIQPLRCVSQETVFEMANNFDINGKLDHLLMGS